MIKENKGQVTIFIIMGILIVASVIVIVYMIRNNRPTTNTLDSSDPTGYMATCIRTALRDTTETMLPQGGIVDPKDYKVYRGAKVAYVCKNVNYYQPCVNQYPRYITEVANQLKEGVGNKVSQCLIALEEDLKNKGYDVQEDIGSNYSVDIKPGVVSATVLKKLTITRGDSIRTFNSFSGTFSSPLYDLASTVNEIISQEARFCNFETLGFSLLYPKYDITRYTLSDSTKIYTIAHVETGKKMNIAIRGCAIPAGF